MSKQIKAKVISGLFWNIMEKGSVQGIQFIIQIILARLLLPEDYGVLALVAIFIAVSNVFVQNGFNTALIQKKEVDDVDYSSVFYLNVFVSLILYLILFIVAPVISRVYEEPQLIPILRVLALTLIFTALSSIQNAIIARKMQFKKVFYSSLGGILASGVTGVTMAYMGFGVWSLVAQLLISNLFTTCILWFTVKWHPKLLFSFSKLKGLFKFGWKLLTSALIDTAYNNIYGLVIGKNYTRDMLGYYQRGDQFPNLLVTNINGSIGSVLFPAMSENQDDIKMMKAIVRRSIVISSFIIFPAMIGLAACSESLVMVLLTDKWLPCVPFLQLLCLSYALWPIHTANLQAINALGRSDIFLKLEIIKKAIGVVVLCISIPRGIYFMVALKTITGFISTLINSFPNKKLLGYSFKEQWMDVMPSLQISLVMGAIVFSLNYIGISSFFTLVLQIIVGVISYIGLALLFKLECLTYLIDTVKDIITRHSLKGSEV